MKRNRKKTKDSGPGVPAYIVTFSDMVTLLLTFFVMLLSMAQTQDESLLNKGRDSFIRSIKNFGLGMLYKARRMPDFGNTKIKYFIEKADEGFEVRTIDVREDETKRAFQDLHKSSTALPSQIVANKINFAVTDIRFSPADATLNSPAKDFLSQFCLNLQQTAGLENAKLYVLGMATSEPTEKQQWILSARRAQAVADFLRSGLSSAGKRPIYSWGAGSGGLWAEKDSPFSERSQISIAVLRGD